MKRTTTARRAAALLDLVGGGLCVLLLAAWPVIVIYFTRGFTSVAPTIALGLLTAAAGYGIHRASRRPATSY